ncbi:MAG: hypothetical protein ACTHKK_01585 [Candidatus Nitrosocosmicus sp.]
MSKRSPKEKIMSILNDNDKKSPELKASIVEPILSFCSSAITFNFLLVAIQKIFQLSPYDLKIYLFYMIEYGVVFYNGRKQEFKIDKGGIDLLHLLKNEKIQKKDIINDITITFENN